MGEEQPVHAGEGLVLTRDGRAYVGEVQLRGNVVFMPAGRLRHAGVLREPQPRAFSPLDVEVRWGA